MANGTGTPCGACKFLRRKCAADCIFAPYFCSDQGPARFAAIHKVSGRVTCRSCCCMFRCRIGAKRWSPLRMKLRPGFETLFMAVLLISLPCSSSQQVAYLQSQLMQVRGQLAQNMIESSKNQWTNSANSSEFASLMTNFPTTNYANSFSPQSSICSLDSLSPAGTGAGAGSMQEMMRERGDDFVSGVFEEEKFTDGFNRASSPGS